jgi:hypothetical protein
MKARQKNLAFNEDQSRKSRVCIIYGQIHRLESILLPILRNFAEKFTARGAILCDFQEHFHI